MNSFLCSISHSRWVMERNVLIESCSNYHYRRFECGKKIGNDFYDRRDIMIWRRGGCIKTFQNRFKNFLWLISKIIFHFLSRIKLIDLLMRWFAYLLCPFQPKYPYLVYLVFDYFRECKWSKRKTFLKKATKVLCPFICRVIFTIVTDPCSTDSESMVQDNLQFGIS